MKANADREHLEKLVLEHGKDQFDLLPTNLTVNLKRWKWGHIGWTSPTNMILTAAWRKAFYPNNDCCKIWARDSQNGKIPGSYSIRTADETVTVPVFSKFDLCTGFCSSNSGMQGSRAIEKSRSVGRINRGLKLEQRTVFDSQLFADILNDINDLGELEALAALKHLIAIAHKSKQRRESSNIALKTAPPRINLFAFASLAKDPELTKCITAACLDALYGNLDFELSGVKDFKTASDGQSQKAGDLAITKNGEVIIAVEVKDRSRNLDWQNINNAREIIAKFPSLSAFWFVLESRAAAHSAVVAEMILQTSVESEATVPVTVISLPDLVGLASPIKGYDYLVRQTAHYVTIAPSIKPATKSLWTSHPHTP